MKQAIRLDDDVRAVLSRAEIEGNTLRISERLDRKLYERVNRALEALGGVWRRNARGHVFTGDPRAAIATAAESGNVAHPNEHDFFPTPPEVAALACQRLDADRNHRILEPSAGEGDLIVPLIKWNGLPRHGDLVLYEKDPRRCAVLRKKGLGDGFLVEADFLAATPPTLLFDRLIMNPPFHRGADALHISHALDFVAPGGRIVAIASAGLKTREDKATKALRDRLAAWGAFLEDLPDGSFKSSGTNVATILIVAIRPRSDATRPGMTVRTGKICA